MGICGIRLKGLLMSRLDKGVRRVGLLGVSRISWGWRVRLWGLCVGFSKFFGSIWVFADGVLSIHSIPRVTIILLRLCSIFSRYQLLDHTSVYPALSANSSHRRRPRLFNSRPDPLRTQSIPPNQTTHRRLSLASNLDRHVFALDQDFQNQKWGLSF